MQTGQVGCDRHADHGNRNTWKLPLCFPTSGGGVGGEWGGTTYPLFTSVIPPLEEQNQLLPHHLVAEREQSCVQVCVTHQSDSYARPKRDTNGL